MKYVQLLAFVVGMVLVALAGWGAFEWTVNRVYVPPGKGLMLRYKGPLLLGSKIYAKPGKFADESAGEIGVYGELRGPGRHFYCPLWYERAIVSDVVVPPGSVAVVTSKMGESLPAGEFLVDGEPGATEFKGVLRSVLRPGRYRINPYAYDVKLTETQIEKIGLQEKMSGWVQVPTGHCGVVTYLTENKAEQRKAGIQDDVLPPGLYAVNPREKHIDVIEIGYRETTIQVDKQTGPDGREATDESGEPVPIAGTGIDFPSEDAFKIQMDFTAIWGVMPDQAADVVRKFGNISAVEQKVILPQAESICRTSGSKSKAKDLLVGESREEFQKQISDDFAAVLKEKDLTLLYGLVRHIYIPRDVRLPIQQSFVADELKLTRDQETLTARTEALLREAEKTVDLEAEKIRAETEKLVAEEQAKGDKQAKEIGAETQQMVAAIDKQIAELDAQKEVLLGEAEAKADQLQQEAKAERFKLAVEAFGSAPAFTQWQFAEGLPENIELRTLYAGEGTLWTDLKGIQPVLPLTGPQPMKAEAEPRPAVPRPRTSR